MTIAVERHKIKNSTLTFQVMLMNLTRMRNSVFKNDLQPNRLGWGEMLLPLYHKYRYNITWGDQDLLNIVFHHNPGIGKVTMSLLIAVTLRLVALFRAGKTHIRRSNRQDIAWPFRI